MRWSPPQGGTRWPLYRDGWQFYRHTATRYALKPRVHSVTMRALTRRGLNKQLARGTWTTVPEKTRPRAPYHRSGPPYDYSQHAHVPIHGFDYFGNPLYENRVLPWPGRSALDVAKRRVRDRFHEIGEWR